MIPLLKHDPVERDPVLIGPDKPVLVVVFRIVPGIVQISQIRSVVVAIHAPHPDSWGRTSSGRRRYLHHVMMSPMSGQGGRSGESEDSKTNNDASAHSQFPLVIVVHSRWCKHSLTQPEALLPTRFREHGCAHLGLVVFDLNLHGLLQTLGAQQPVYKCLIGPATAPPIM